MIDHVLNEIRDLFGINLKSEKYENMKVFSYFLRSAYDFFLCGGKGVQFLLICNKEAMKLTPTMIAKHIEIISKAANIPVVFTTKKMVSYNRLRLLKKKVPVVIPGKHIYLPFLGVALSRTTPTQIKEFSALSNPAQQILFGKLSNRLTMPLSITSMCEQFKYSRVSVIKAFDELEYFELAVRDSKTKKLMFLFDNKNLWEKAQPFLHNPCRRIIGVKKIPKGLKVMPAGTTALAKMSMLCEGEQSEYAVHIKDFNKASSLERVPKEDAPILLQLWDYKPTFLDKKTIDPFSLYLTLQDQSDDRIQIALEEVIKERLI